jgi:hypothetical protein
MNLIEKARFRSGPFFYVLFGSSLTLIAPHCGVRSGGESLEAGSESYGVNAPSRRTGSM